MADAFAPLPQTVTQIEAEAGTEVSLRSFSPERVGDAAAALGGGGGDPNPADVSQVEAEAGTEAANRSWSPVRVAQAIAALETGEVNPAEVSQLEAETGIEAALRAFSPLRVAQAIAALEAGEANPASASQVEAEAGTEAALRAFSPLRIAQAIAALESTGTGVTQLAVLDSTTTSAELNTALTNNRIVYLLPGSYTMTATVTVPEGKSLIAMDSGGGDAAEGSISSGRAAFTITTNAAHFDVRGEMRGVHVIVNATQGATPTVRTDLGDGNHRCNLIGVSVDMGSGSNTGALITVGTGSYLLQCSVDNSGGDGYSIEDSAVVGGAPRPILLDGCIATNCTGDGFELTADLDGVTLRGCVSRGNSSAGFRLAEFTSAVGEPFFVLDGCKATNNQNGFFSTGVNTNYPVRVINCYAEGNSVRGFDLTAGAASNILAFARSTNNTTANYNISGWTQVSNV